MYLIQNLLDEMDQPDYMIVNVRTHKHTDKPAHRKTYIYYVCLHMYVYSSTNLHIEPIVCIWYFLVFIFHDKKGMNFITFLEPLASSVKLAISLH